MAAVARMENMGTPIDTGSLHRLQTGWDAIKLTLIREVDTQTATETRAVARCGIGSWIFLTPPKRRTPHEQGGTYLSLRCPTSVPRVGHM